MPISACVKPEESGGSCQVTIVTLVSGFPLDEGALWLITPTQPPRTLAGHNVQGVG